jgi:hypothetical protein
VHLRGLAHLAPADDVRRLGTRLEERLAAGEQRIDHPPVDEALITREEMTQMMLAILDIGDNTTLIRDILEEDDGGEDAEEEA